MKIKKEFIIIVILILLCLFLYTKSSNMQISHKTTEIELTEKAYRAEEKVVELETMMNKLNREIDDYEIVFNNLVEPYYNISTHNVLKRAFDYKAQIIFGIDVIDIPINGKVKLATESFEFNASVVNPPILREAYLNNLLANYGISDIRQLISFQIPTDSHITESNIQLFYRNLEVGDTVLIEPTPEFVSKFDLSTDTIEIEIVGSDYFLHGTDYFPDQPLIKKFTGGYENGGFTERYGPVMDNKIEAEHENDAVHQKRWYNIDDSVILESVTSESDKRDVNRMVLPESIQLGQVIESDYREKIITGIEVFIETPAGIFSCVEVTSYYDDGERSISYYGKGVGLVKSTYSGLTDELISIEYLE